jgi:hypothetical protein
MQAITTGSSNTIAAADRTVITIEIPRTIIKIDAEKTGFCPVTTVGRSVEPAQPECFLRLVDGEPRIV